MPDAAVSQATFAQATRQFLPRLYRLARRLTPQTSDAEDLVHDAYIKAHRACRQAHFRSAEDCYAWLTRILINTYRDQYRRHQRSPTVSLVIHSDEDGRGDPVALAADVRPGPAAEVEARQFAQAAQAAILDLPPELRLIVALFLLDGLTYERVAERAELPIGTVMSRLWRARRLLRESLRDYVMDGGDANLPGERRGKAMR